MARYCRTVDLDSDVHVAVRRGVAISLFQEQIRRVFSTAAALPLVSSQTKYGLVFGRLMFVIRENMHILIHRLASTSNRTIIGMWLD
jgi:hypothetical protein